jgi:protein-L-isoaspartate O-methyltransferase
LLEIGTGTGYNAALLCHRLGAESVFSVDIGAGLVAAARERLAALGYAPTLVAADGRLGLPGHGPFDRIIATCDDHLGLTAPQRRDECSSGGPPSS